MLIDGYTIRTGEHCGSTAMRDLLLHYSGLDLSEACVLGLGSALNCMVIEPPAPTPPMVFGRGVTMEVDCAAALGIDYTESPDFDDAQAWRAVRAEVEAGRPTMLSGDVFYLDYHPSFSKVHFPAHRFVLLGFDDALRQAHVADRQWLTPQSCGYDALAASRAPKDWPVSTFNLWGRFGDDPAPRRSLPEAMKTAIELSADRMLGRDTTQASLVLMALGGVEGRVSTGLSGIARLGALLPSFEGREDARAMAKGLYYTFERFGTGGGNFRRLYTAFLLEAQALLPAVVSAPAISLAQRSADAWSQLAADMLALSRGEPIAWSACGDAVMEIEGIERALFEDLAGALKAA